MEDKKRSARKQGHLDANLARHAANVARVADLGIPQATTDSIKTKRDGKGNAYTVTVTKRVRESKLLRLSERSSQRRLAAAYAESIALAEDALGTTAAYVNAN